MCVQCETCFTRNDPLFSVFGTRLNVFFAYVVDQILVLEKYSRTSTDEICLIENIFFYECTKNVCKKVKLLYHPISICLVVKIFVPMGLETYNRQSVIDENSFAVCFRKHCTNLMLPIKVIGRFISRLFLCHCQDMVSPSFKCTTDTLVGITDGRAVVFSSYLDMASSTSSL